MESRKRKGERVVTSQAAKRSRNEKTVEKEEEDRDEIVRKEEEEEEEDYDWAEMDKQEEMALIERVKNVHKKEDNFEYIKNLCGVELGENETLSLQHNVSNLCFGIFWIWENSLRIGKYDKVLPPKFRHHDKISLFNECYHPYVKRKYSHLICDESVKRNHPEALYWKSKMTFDSDAPAAVGAMWLYQAAQFPEMIEAQLAYGVYIEERENRIEDALEYVLKAAFAGFYEAQALIGTMAWAGFCGTDVRGKTLEKKEKVKEEKKKEGEGEERRGGGDGREEERGGEREGGGGEEEEDDESEEGAFLDLLLDGEEDDDEESDDDDDDDDDDDESDDDDDESDDEEEERFGPWSGWGEEVLSEIAVEWLKLSADQGYPSAYTGLAELFENTDLEKSLHFRKLAAQNGEAFSCTYLFKYYRSKMGAGDDGQNSEKAKHYLLLGIELGSGEHQYELGMLHWRGCDSMDIEKNFKKAKTWLRKAAKQGNMDASASLGQIYALGRNYDKAQAFLCRGVLEAHPPSMGTMGYLLVNGLAEGGVCSFNQHHGAVLMCAAASCGDELAGFHLGWCYLFGLGVKKNFKLAANFLRKVKGVFSAVDGIMSFFGLDGEVDYKKAMECLVDSEIEPAIYLVGNMYENGLGVERDLKKAKEYYQKALDEGLAMAQEGLDRLENK